MHISTCQRPQLALRSRTPGQIRAGRVIPRASSARCVLDLDPCPFTHDRGYIRSRSLAVTRGHARSRTVTHGHARSRTVTHGHARSRTVTHGHSRSLAVGISFPAWEARRLSGRYPPQRGATRLATRGVTATTGSPTMVSRSGGCPTTRCPTTRPASGSPRRTTRASSGTSGASGKDWGRRPGGATPFRRRRRSAATCRRSGTTSRRGLFLSTGEVTAAREDRVAEAGAGGVTATGTSP